MRHVEVDWAPAYELVVSLQAVTSRSDHKTLELGLEWVKRVRQQVQLPAESAAVMEYSDALHPLIRQCPAERNVAGFLGWLASLPAGELYERLEPDILRGRKDVLSTLGTFRDRSVELLSIWNDRYFSQVDPAILAGLAADAVAKRELLHAITPEQVLEIATTGILFSDETADETILLVPQYHYRPWNVYSDYQGWRLFAYPADALSPVPDEPPPRLLRVTRALADPSRLRILRHLASEPRRFGDLVQVTGLSKSTVHHHMVILRAAGLVHVHEKGTGPDTYSLRPHVAEDLGDVLSTYISGGPPGTPPASRSVS